MQSNNKVKVSDFDYIVSLLNSGKNVFVTGSAGTGKSYLLNKLKNYYGNTLTVTSSTGVSAVNINGTTIHSWANVGCMDQPIDSLVEILSNTDLGPDNKSRNKIKKCKMLAIDEISMLSAYQLEYLDAVFRAVRKDNRPFGGIQVLFMGDFMQLPPVATEIDLKYYPRRGLFCFDSTVWYDLDLVPVLLTHVYRQQDSKFIELLNRFRVGKVTVQDMMRLSCRSYEDIKLENKLHLFATRNDADNYNKACLDKLNTPEFEYTSYDDIPEPIDLDIDMYDYRRKVWGKLMRYCNAKHKLHLKVGCRVMLLLNLDFSKGLINGACGYVTKLSKATVEVHFDNGADIKLGKRLFEYVEGENTIAKRFQIPLQLAYAVTIHKAQGMTFDEAVIDCRQAFAPGQVYVGLSRVKSLSGLYITGFNPKKVKSSKKATSFYSEIERILNDNIKNSLSKYFVIQY